MAHSKICNLRIVLNKKIGYYYNFYKIHAFEAQLLNKGLWSLTRWFRTFNICTYLFSKIFYERNENNILFAVYTYHNKVK